MKLRLHLALTTVVFMLFSATVWGQTPASPGLFSKLEIVEGKLVGESLASFLQRCHESHYVMFGEAHGVDGVAEFVGATQVALSEKEFRTVVLEAGDWFTSQLSLHDMEKTLERYPYSLAFDYDGDLQMIAAAKAVAGENVPVLIGVDQEANSIHPFEYLGEHAKSRSARRFARGLQLKALFLGGAYIRGAFFDDLKVLESKIGNDPTSAALVRSLQSSMSIFYKHVSGDVNESVAIRESMMMRLFDEAVEQIQESKKEPRMLFKMGGAHVVRGIGPNGIATLGDHVARKAQERGQESFHIGIRKWLGEEDAIQLPAAAQQFDYVYVDCSQLKASVEGLGDDADDGAEQNQRLNQLLNRYDAMILIPGAGKASKSRISMLEKRFVRGKLMTVAMVVVPILMLLPVCWVSLRASFALLRKRATERDGWLFCLPAMVSLVMVGMITWQICVTALAPDGAEASSGWFTFVWDTFCVMAIAGMAYVAFMMDAKKWWNGTRRILYWVGWVSCVFLFTYIYYWNIGGHLGV